MLNGTKSAEGLGALLENRSAKRMYRASLSGPSLILIVVSLSLTGRGTLELGGCREKEPADDKNGIMKTSSFWNAPS